MAVNESIAFIIGSTDNAAAQLKLEDPAVSFRHACIRELNVQGFVLEDLSSRNGTKVNDRYIKTKLTDETDIVRIGQYSFLGHELLILARKELNKSRIQFFDEFDELLLHFEEYQKSLKKLNESYKQKVALVRYGLPVVFFALFIFWGEQLGIPQSLRLLVPLLGGGIASLFADKLFSQDDLRANIQSLREQYTERLMCPKCHLELINKTPGYWVRKRRCPRCNANWVR